MAKVTRIILWKVTKVTFVTTIFLVINVNEVIMIDNTQWISITLYMVQAWKRIPILLFVETIHVFDTSNNIFSLMLKWFQVGGMGWEIGQCGVWWGQCFLMQSNKCDVAIQGKDCPFVNDIRWFVHKTNLVVVSLLKLDLMHWLKVILQHLYVYFAHNLKNL